MTVVISAALEVVLISDVGLTLNNNSATGSEILDVTAL